MSTLGRYMEVTGFQGIIGACLVAVKQVMPEDEITVLSFIRFRAKVRAIKLCLLLARAPCVSVRRPQMGTLAHAQACHHP